MHENNVRFKEIIRIVEKFCFDREDPVRAISEMRFFPEGYDAFGIEDEELKVLRDRILAEFDPSPPEIADLGKILFAMGKYEYGSLAIMLIKKHRPRVDRYVFEGVIQWFEKGVENWAHADILAIKILPVFYELEIADLKDFEELRASKSRWLRRAAAVSMNYFRRALEAEVILGFLKPLLPDTQKVVQHGVGNALNELWHKNHEPVEAFLNENKAEIQFLTLRNACTGMPHAKSRALKKENPNYRQKTYKKKPRPNPRRNPKK